MANTTLFSSVKRGFARADAVNEAGGRAYKLAPKHARAQMSATGWRGRGATSTMRCPAVPVHSPTGFLRFRRRAKAGPASTSYRR